MQPRLPSLGFETTPTAGPGHRRIRSQPSIECFRLVAVRTLSDQDSLWRVQLCSLDSRRAIQLHGNLSAHTDAIADAFTVDRLVCMVASCKGGLQGFLVCRRLFKLI